MKNNLTIIIGIGALLIIGVAVLGYYLGIQKVDEDSLPLQSNRKKNERGELHIEFAPNGMPMDLYLEEQKKLASETLDKTTPDNEKSEKHPKKGANILTDAQIIINREITQKERIKELKKIAKENPDSPQALSEESIKRMEQEGISEQ